MFLSILRLCPNQSINGWHPQAQPWPLARPSRRGLGRHDCLDQHPVLPEVRIMVEEFLARVPRFGFVVEDAALNPSYFQQRWIRLPVSVEG